MAKAFSITSKDQYIQDIKLNRGTYTFSAWVLALGSNYSIGLKTQAGTWLNFNMADQIQAQEWRKVKLTFTLYEPCVQFSLMNTFASGAAYVIVAAPMLEEGTNAGTQKPNELDLDESIGDGAYTMLLSNPFHNFAGSTNTALAGTAQTDILVYKNGERILPTSITVYPGTLPMGMTATTHLSTGRVIFTVTSAMTTASGTVNIGFVINGTSYTLGFNYAISFKGADGTSKDLRLDASTNIIRKLKNGTWNPSTDVTVTATAVNTTITTWEYSVNGGTFSNTPPIGVTRSGNVVSINPSSSIAYALYTIRVSDGTISDTVSVARIEDGTDGKNARSPYVGENGNWYVWNDTTQQYVDSGEPAHGDDGKSPYIGANGNWYVWDGAQWVDTGIKAQGTPGESGISIKLSNESHTFAGSATAALAGSANTTILAFKGTQQITPTSVTLNTSDLPTGMTRTINGSVITFTVTTSMTSSSGVIPITVVIDGKTFTLQFSYSIAFKGTDGLSKGIYLNAATQVIKYNAAGTPTPATNFTVVGTAVNTTISTWQYSVNGGTFSSTRPAGVGRSGNTVTISPTTITFNTLSIRASDGTISDTASIMAVRDGGNGLPGKMPIQIEWVQGETHLNNDTVIHYIYYRAGNTWWRLKDAYTERVATASPSTTYYQQLSSVEVMVTKILIAEEGNLGGLIFKNNKFISQKGMINGVESTDYSNPAFVPNVHIDGETGEIVANKLLNPFIVSDPDIAGDLQEKLTNNHNIYLEAGGAVTYGWKEHILPGTGTLADKRLDGLNIKIYAPAGGGNNRIKIVSAGSGMIFGDVPGGIVPSLKLVMGTRDTIHLSAVWNRVNEVLDWVMTSRTSYQIITNQGDASEIRVPNVFKENDIISKGVVSASAAFSNLLNRYGANISCSVSSGKFTLSIPRLTYLSPTGTALNRAMSDDQFDLQVIPNTSSHRTTYIYKRYGTVNGITGVHFDIEFRTYNGSTATATAFKFVLRALDYVFNNIYLDDTL